MNCENYQGLLSDFVDGSLTPDDQARIQAHLTTCPGCTEVHDDLVAITGFCLQQRGDYDPVPNERALWQRISNIIEAEFAQGTTAHVTLESGWWFRLMNRSWQVTFPQLAASATALVLLVSLVSVFSIRRLTSTDGPRTAVVQLSAIALPVSDRYRQQQQIIDYWNRRVELNKARWSPQMRQTFDSNMSVIDAAVNDSLSRLAKDPHDEVSEEILTGALNDKVELLKEFSDL